MTTFEVNNVHLSAPTPNGTSFQVVSAYRTYDVIFHEVDVDKILAQGDFLFIDETVDKILNHISFTSKRSFTATEERKSIYSSIDLLDDLVLRNFTKANKLLVVGGGITQDVGALCAALFKRGISWEFVPTTLLSMCDSCIGSKCGVNHRDAKNQIGVFFPPSRVHIDMRFLQTLDEEHVASGMGEILKLCAIGNIPFDMRKGLPYLLHQALLVKRVVVHHDEFEITIRAALNYGHSFGHVIEVLSEYKIPHGTAVVLGMMTINQLFSVEDPVFWEQCKSLLAHIDRACLASVTEARFSEVLLRDKKVTNKIITLIVTSNGKTNFVRAVVDEKFVHQVCTIIRGLTDA